MVTQTTETQGDTEGNSDTTAAKAEELCRVEERTKAWIEISTYGEINARIEALTASGGQKGLMKKWDRKKISFFGFFNIPLPLKIPMFSSTGTCYYCGDRNSKDYPGGLYKIDHRGKQKKVSSCGYCMMCGDDRYELKYLHQGEYYVWKKRMKLTPDPTVFNRTTRFMFHWIPIIGRYVEETRVEQGAVVTNGRKYKSSQRHQAFDTTDEAMLQQQDFHLSKAADINHRMQMGGVRK